MKYILLEYYDSEPACKYIQHYNYVCDLNSISDFHVSFRHKIEKNSEDKKDKKYLKYSLFFVLSHHIILCDER